jgi:hypothetical protein
MATIRTLLSEMQTIDASMMKLRRWVSAENVVVATIRAAVRKVVRFSRMLDLNRQIFNGSGPILHTYAEGGGEQGNHIEADMAALDQFCEFFQPLTGQNLANNQVIDNFLGATAEGARNKITRLLYLYNRLKQRMELMTRKMLQECFEPCIRAAMRNAFHIPGKEHEVGAIGQDVIGVGFSDTVSVAKNYSESEFTHETPALALAGVDGNPEDAPQLAEIPASSSKTATVLTRTFPKGSACTQFVRSLIFVTNVGGREQFQNLANGVIRDPEVNDMPDTPDLGEVTLRTVIKASKDDLAPHVPTNASEYTVAHCRVTEDPVIASFYMDVTHEE